MTEKQCENKNNRKEERNKEMDKTKMKREDDKTATGTEMPSTTFGQSRLKSFFLVVVSIVKTFKVDPVIIAHCLGTSLVMVEMSNLYIEKTCRVGSYFFGNVTYSPEVCSNIYNGSFVEEQEEVQKTVAKVQMVSEILKSVPSVLFALFLGPWSDTFGRKFLLVISNLGIILSILVFVLNVYFFDQLFVEFLWLESLGALGGLYATFWMGVYSFAGDVSTDKTRTVRIALCDGVASVSSAVGNSINGYVFERFDYYGSFGFGIGCLAASILYTLFVLKERKTEEQKERSKGMKNPFSLKYAKEGFRIVFKKRENSLRGIIILLILCYGVSILVYTGVEPLEFLYVRKSFNWTEATDNPKFVISWYTQFRSYCSLTSIFSFFVVLPLLTNVLKLHDMTIEAVAAVSFFAYMAIFAAAPPDRNLLYISVPFVAFTNIITSPLRSAITKIVGEADIGKAFACVGAIGSITALAAPLYNLLYVNTLEFYAGFYLLVTIGIFFFLFLAVLFILYHLKKVDKKTKKNNVGGSTIYELQFDDTVAAP